MVRLFALSSATGNRFDNLSPDSSESDHGSDNRKSGDHILQSIFSLIMDQYYILCSVNVSHIRILSAKFLFR